MSTNTQSADLIRVTVTAGDRTLDLVLPSRLPLAEIVPEVAGLIGSLDAYEAYGGYALVGSDGRALDLDASFLAQGVHDGQVLTLVTGAEAEEKKVYDDVVEAVADSVEGLGRPATLPFVGGERPEQLETRRAPGAQHRER